MNLPSNQYDRSTAATAKAEIDEQSARTNRFELRFEHRFQ